MHIRLKSNLIIGASLAALTFAAMLTVGTLTFSTSRHNETTLCKNNMRVVYNTIQRDIQSLMQSATDYSMWDDTYTYAADTNRAFVDSNFIPSMFMNNRISFVLIADNSGRTLFSRAADPSSGEEVEAHPGLVEQVSTGSIFFTSALVGNATKGLIVASGTVFEVASSPVMPTSGEGPSRGMLFFGRLLSEGEVKRIAEQTLLAVELIRPTDPAMPKEVLGVPHEGDQVPEPVVSIVDSQTIAGYDLLRDVLGRPAIVASVKSERTFYRQAMAGLGLIAALILVLGLTTLVGSTFMLDRLILTRLGRLGDFVKSSGVTRGFSERIDVQGHDEITDLARAFNDVLDRMEQAIAASRKAEAARTETERVFYTLLSNLQGMVYRCTNDANWTMSFVSEGCRELTGYEPSDLQNNRTISYSDIIVPEDRKQVWDNVQAAISARTPFTLNYRIRCRNGDAKWILEQGRGIFDDKGNLLFLEGFNTDVTELHRAREEQAALEKQMLQAQKLESLGLMAGGIAHDFNNLLMTILGNADLSLMDLPMNSPIRENIEDIEKASKRAAELCRQLLAYSGRGKFVVESLDISKLVQETGRMLSVSISKKAIMNYNLTTGLPAIDADAAQVHQVVMNLVINASEAIGDREGVIAISTGTQIIDSTDAANSFPCPPLPGAYVFVEISDTGCGIEPGKVGQIFDPFYTTKFTGRGLGLAAVMGIVRGHHGCIQITSKPGAGSTFRVLFPVSQRQVSNTVPKPKSPGEWRGHGTILLVDDEPFVRKTVALMLRDCGFEVIQAVDGLEAVEIFRIRQNEISCVLLDLTMPKMNGVEAFKELTKIDPAVKIILSSGFDAAEMVTKYGNMNFAGFLQKPYTHEPFQAELRRVLES